MKPWLCHGDACVSLRDAHYGLSSQCWGKEILTPWHPFSESQPQKACRNWSRSARADRLFSWSTFCEGAQRRAVAQLQEKWNWSGHTCSCFAEWNDMRLLYVSNYVFEMAQAAGSTCVTTITRAYWCFPNKRRSAIRKLISLCTPLALEFSWIDQNMDAKSHTLITVWLTHI